jgi:very-short-patch-repair endonuclease
MLHIRGIHVLRFSNLDVLKNLEGVLLTVVEEVTSLTPTLSQREREK